MLADPDTGVELECPQTDSRHSHAEPLLIVPALVTVTAPLKFTSLEGLAGIEE